MKSKKTQKVVPLRPDVEDVMRRIDPAMVDQVSNQLIRYANEIDAPLIIIGFDKYKQPVCTMSERVSAHAVELIGALECAKYVIMGEEDAETD